MELGSQAAARIEIEVGNADELARFVRGDGLGMELGDVAGSERAAFQMRSVVRSMGEKAEVRGQRSEDRVFGVRGLVTAFFAFCFACHQVVYVASGRGLRLLGGCTVNWRTGDVEWDADVKRKR